MGILMIITRQEQDLIVCMPCSTASMLESCNYQCGPRTIRWEFLEMKNLEPHPIQNIYNSPFNKIFQVKLMHIKV